MCGSSECLRDRLQAITTCVHLPALMLQADSTLTRCAAHQIYRGSSPFIVRQLLSCLSVSKGQGQGITANTPTPSILRPDDSQSCAMGASSYSANYGAIMQRQEQDVDMVPGCVVCRAGVSRASGR